jgi:hypothetical protein
MAFNEVSSDIDTNWRKYMTFLGSWRGYKIIVK